MWQSIGEDPRAVFDAGSVVAVLLDGDTPSLSVWYDGHVLDLTFYEAGNVLWKVHTIRERTTAGAHSSR